MSGLIVIEKFYDPGAALAARAYLEQHGLLALVPDYNFYSAFPHWGLALGGFRLMVHRDDHDVARRLLNSGESGSYETCPRCESNDILHFTNPTAALFVAFAMVAPPRLVNRSRCTSCGHRWRRAPLPPLIVWGMGFLFVAAIAGFLVS